MPPNRVAKFADVTDVKMKACLSVKHSTEDGPT